jgi:hypothetical protein
VVCNPGVSRVCNIKNNFSKNNLSLHFGCMCFHVTCLALGGLQNLCTFLEKFLDQRVDAVILQEEVWKCLSHNSKYDCSSTLLVKDKLDRPYWELIANKRQHTHLFRSFLLFAEEMCS